VNGLKFPHENIRGAEIKRDVSTLGPSGQGENNTSWVRAMFGLWQKRDLEIGIQAAVETSSMNRMEVILGDQVDMGFLNCFSIENHIRNARGKMMTIGNQPIKTIEPT
jgi:hypothetical protein